MKEASVVAAVSQETLRPSSGQTTPVSIAALRKEPSVRGGRFVEDVFSRFAHGRMGAYWEIGTRMVMTADDPRRFQTCGSSACLRGAETSA